MNKMIYMTALAVFTGLNIILVYKNAVLLHEVCSKIEELNTKTKEINDILDAYHEVMDPFIEEDKYKFRFEPVQDNNDK